jgi:hypothetical protein
MRRKHKREPEQAEPVPVLSENPTQNPTSTPKNPTFNDSQRDNTKQQQNRENTANTAFFRTSQNSRKQATELRLITRNEKVVGSIPTRSSK